MERIIENKKLKLVCAGDNTSYREQIYLKGEDGDRLVLESFPHVTGLLDERLFAVYYQEQEQIEDLGQENGILRVLAEHPDYTLHREISMEKLLKKDGDEQLNTCEHTIHFRVTLTAKKSLCLRAAEDKWNYMIPKRETDTAQEGPLDFVWSQRIKSVPMDIISHYNFRTPIVMMQQNEIFAGIIAGLEGILEADLERLPLGMDLNVTENIHPWFSYGGVGIRGLKPDQPCEAGHTHIIRGSDSSFVQIHLEAGESCTYCYTLMVRQAPYKLGYREAVRYLWNRYKAYREETCEDLYENVRFPEIFTLRQWEEEIWDRRTAEDFYTYEKNGKTVGAVTGRRQGEWFSRTNYKHDAWFACWLQELVTGYGMYRYGEKTGNREWVNRAGQILDLILGAPRTNGMFPVICYLEEDGTETWLRDDGWAGYRDEFHTLQMSYTAWLLVLWAKKVFPDREQEILDFCIPYGEFLLKVQHEDGCIPSWFNEKGEPSRLQFRDFNAETAASALFLLELGEFLGRGDFINAGMSGVEFIDRYVRPRQRWFDLETFLSCAKKSFSFYDGITAQYPQCNLSAIFASFAYLKRFRMTKCLEDQEKAEEVVDYLLLTQQLWNHPGIQIDTFGGFTVQNTDNEWNDAREALCAILLYEYYIDTGKWEYLERAAAAMHGGFQNLPYENWAHCGYEGMQYDSSLLWGCGIILAAAEYLDKKLELISVDVHEKKALGLWGIKVLDVTVEGKKIHIHADIPPRLQKEAIRVKVYNGETAVHEVFLNREKIPHS
ncbi:MAG: hypothetical protein QM697_14620 [Lachnospiraceae bacterium]